MVQGNRNLKNAARARMEETNESYAEALAQVKSQQVFRDLASSSEAKLATWDVLAELLGGTWVKGNTYRDDMPFAFIANKDGSKVEEEDLENQITIHTVDTAGEVFALQGKLGEEDVIVSFMRDHVWFHSTPVQKNGRSDLAFAKTIARLAGLVLHAHKLDMLDSLVEVNEVAEWSTMYSPYGEYEIPGFANALNGNWGSPGASTWDVLAQELDCRWETYMGNDEVVGLFWSPTMVHTDSWELNMDDVLHFTTDLSLTMNDSIFGNLGEEPVSVEIRTGQDAPVLYTAPVSPEGKSVKQFVAELVSLGKTLTKARSDGKDFPVETFTALEWQLLPVNLKARERRAEAAIAKWGARIEELEGQGVTNEDTSIEGAYLRSAREFLNNAHQDVTKVVALKAIEGNSKKQ